jgi:hypothetical protein
MSRWFRFYDGALDDPKVQRLEPKLFKTWVNLLCVASRHEGRLPPLVDLAFALRMSEADASKALSALSDVGLVDETEEAFEPHNWSGRQHKSDDSNERVKRYRDKRRNADVTVAVTPPETDTEVEAEKKDSEAVASGAVAPIAEPVYADAKHELWAEGVLLLGQLGLNEAKARQMIGRWCRDTGNDYAGVMTAIQQARDQRPPGDIVGWITRALPTKANHERNRQTRPPNAHDTIFAAVGELLDGLPDGGRREAGASGAIDAERDGTGVYRLSG